MNSDKPVLDVLLRDLRYTFRTLRRDRGFALIAVLILALGIGANIAVFSVVNTILLRPLPFRDAEQLVRIVEKNPTSGESSKTYTADATQDFQQQNHSFQSVSGYFAFTPPDNFKLVGNGQPVPVTGLLVVDGFFQTLGVEPSLGRLFRPEEFVQHAQPVVLLSAPFWKRQFGGDHSIVGRTIHLNNTSITVIGVLPDTFDFGAVFSPGSKVDLFAPYIMDDFREDGNDLALVGRLRPGVTLAQAAKGEEKRNTGVFVYIVSPGYLKAMGMRLLEGRDISWADLSENRSVVIINQTVARNLWPGQDPVGRTAVAGGADALVIGVIADVHESSAEDNARAQMYLPATKQFGPEGAYLVVRSKLPPAALATTVMRTLREINPGQPAAQFQPIQGLVVHATSPRRFFVLLVGTFAGLGLLLASLGIYGVISYSVTRRTQEIGIRMALGATETRVQLDVIGKTLRLALVGILIGVIASLAVARLIASLLFQTTPTDPVTFAGIAFLLCTVAFVAGYLPARRAAKVDPMVALRYE